MYWIDKERALLIFLLLEIWSSSWRSRPLLGSTLVDYPLLEKGLLVAHLFSLLMVHYRCATSERDCGPSTEKIHVGFKTSS